jgi:hypothetical protein
VKEHVQLKGEIRYAIRLAERSAPVSLVQTVSTFFSILGGSAAFAAIADIFPKELSIGGACVAAVFGSGTGCNPAGGQSSPEADLRRFQSLMARANSLDGNALEAAIEETRQGSAQEIEPLRDVAYNDVVLEFNRSDALIPLSPLRKILRVFA